MTETGAEIAIVGMAGRFPGAPTLDLFWKNLAAGVESIQRFSEDQLRAAGIDADTLRDPGYIRAGAVVENVEMFDAAFFGYSHREAEMMDPQQRVFLECAWEALETAGYSPERYRGAIGVYAGTSMNLYWLFMLYSNPELVRSVGAFQVMTGNDRDYLTTRVSYKLNLRGPSMNVQTACSTAMVAVHLACQSLISGECDMALAGAVSLKLPTPSGYPYQKGGIFSPDGHCRAFDAQGQGTVFGSGAGVVVLKRLVDALADGDHIEAVIKGSAVNNDGGLKVGFTAPGIAGQAAVIEEAQAVARVDPGTITYVEAHGTATPLGDPVEIAALTQAFRSRTDRERFCAIGSVKTNVGHLDAAAGAAGLIKTVLALKHRQLPASLHFNQPNPQIDFEHSPFYVNTALSTWPDGRGPRRAGVSSFGIGGTNAHVVLEEAPDPEPSDAAQPYQLITLSAKTQTALAALAGNLARHLEAAPAQNLADVAYTLQVGRAEFDHRGAAVVDDLPDAVRVTRTLDPERVRIHIVKTRRRPVVFMFSGQGAQYAGMGAGLYAGAPAFREAFDRCAALLEPHLQLDLHDVVYPKDGPSARADQQLEQTRLTQPALFAVAYALAQLWLSWGVEPQALIGHSIGEYVAACLAGVLSLPDALRVVAARGRMMQALPAGAMLSVPLPAQAAQRFVSEAISLAAVNSPTLCVLSGALPEIEALEARLTAEGIVYRRLHTSHAFHSAMMAPMMAPFTDLMRQVRLEPPAVPYVSNLTGTWITDAQATSPAYYAEHLRQPVRFAEGVETLWQDPDRVLLEVGPGRGLGTLAMQRADRSPDSLALASLRHPDEQVHDRRFILQAAGQLWVRGGSIDWEKFYAGQRRGRLALPTYPFDRQRYWLQPGPVPSTQADAAAMPAAGAEYPRPDLPTDFVPPRNAIEESIAVLWRELLGVKDVGVYDSFFDLGGHSLLATQLIARLNDTFPVELSMRRMFEAPTIARLAEAIAELLMERIDGLSDEDAQSLL